MQTAIADPPYNINFDYDGEYADNLPKDQYLNWSRTWMLALLPKLKANGSLWLVISDEYVAELKVLAESIGFQLRSWCIWYFTFGVHCTTKFSRCHQHLLWFGVGSNKPAFYRENILVPSARSARYGDKRAASGGRTPADVWMLFPDQLPEQATSPDFDVWLMSRIAGTFHEREEGAANQLPEALVGRMILATTAEGDAVVDPFSGTGTTATVAKKLRRNYFGFEQSQRICDRSLLRLNNATPGEPLA